MTNITNRKSGRKKTPNQNLEDFVWWGCFKRADLWVEGCGIFRWLSPSWSRREIFFFLEYLYTFTLSVDVLFSYMKLSWPLVFCFNNTIHIPFFYLGLWVRYNIGAFIETMAENTRLKKLGNDVKKILELMEKRNADYESCLSTWKLLCRNFWLGTLPLVKRWHWPD